MSSNPILVVPICGSRPLVPAIVMRDRGSSLVIGDRADSRGVGQGCVGRLAEGDQDIGHMLRHEDQEYARFQQLGRERRKAARGVHPALAEMPNVCLVAARSCVLRWGRSEHDLPKYADQAAR